jgi:Tol biopolymer transport system component
MAKRRLTLALGVAIAVLAGCSDPTAVQEPLVLPLVDRVVFEGNAQDTLGDVFVIKTDGSDRRRLTGNDTADFCPALSPDGSWIAFIRRVPVPGQYFGFVIPSMVLMKADGTGQRVLGSYKTGYTGDCPVWSKDSRLVSFSSPEEPRVRNENFPLVRTYDTGGTLVAQFTALQFGGYSFSPDGTQFLYSTHLETLGAPTNFRLQIVNVDGTGVRDVVSGFHGDWRPDGTGITYDSCSTFCGPNPVAACAGVCVVRVDGSNAQTLTPEGSFPVFSPSGDRIAYSCGNDLCVLSVQGQQYTVISGASQFGRPVWSPDGVHVGYWMPFGSKTDIFVADLRTGLIANLTNTPTDEGTPSFSPVSAH